MMITHTIIDLSEKYQSLSFMNLEDAEAYMKAFESDWNLVKSQYVTHLNAQKYINWNDVPGRLNFIFRDHLGVWASQYKPIAKWYNSNDLYRLYGGERILLPEQSYHHLIKLGDIFERRESNKHFINWNIVKGANFIKFIDNENQSIDVFSDEGKLLVSGSNDELKVINKKGSFQFEKFPWQTYTFAK